MKSVLRHYNVFFKEAPHFISASLGEIFSGVKRKTRKYSERCCIMNMYAKRKEVTRMTEQELENACKEAFSYDGTYVIDCAVDCDEFVLPMLPPGGSIDDIITEL